MSGLTALWRLCRELEIRLADQANTLTKTTAWLRQVVKEQRQLTAALRVAHQEKALILETISDFVELVEPDLRVVWANKVLGKLAHLTPDQLPGRFCFERWQRPDPCPGCPVVKALATGEVRQAELDFPDGKVRVLTGYPLRNLSGKITGVINISIDITEQVKLQEKQRQLEEQKAQVRRVASLSAMSAGIVHEIAQPLNAIKVVADGVLFWQEKGYPLDLAELVENFRRVSLQTTRIDEIIKHIRFFAHRQQERPVSWCSLNQVVTGALDVVGRQLAAHGIAVNTDLAANLPLVAGDFYRLEEVVINLLINAMQVLDPVSRGDKHVWCVTREQAGQVRLEVSDNGTGVPADIIDLIFEPAFSTKEQGMGLGLAIARSIVVSYQGRIGVLNNRYGGATFWVELPLKSQLEGDLAEHIVS